MIQERESDPKSNENFRDQEFVLKVLRHENGSVMLQLQAITASKVEGESVSSDC